MNTFLILHGWGSCAGNWLQVKKILENQGNKVFLPDLPGFGESPPPSKAWSLNDYVEWVREFCEKNNLSQIFLLGHSFGGAIAVKFSIKYLQRIKKLILIDCAGIRKKRIKKEIQKKIAHFLNKFSFLPFYGFLKKIAYRTLFCRSDYLLAEERGGEVMKKTYLNIIREDISNSFSNIFVPVLLVWGKKDKITPLEHAYFMKEKIAGAKLEIIPNVKHNPHFEAPEILVKKILSFIKV